MNRGLRVRCFLPAGFALCLAACGGSEVRDGRSCTIGQNDAGASILVCPDGTEVVLPSTASGSTVSSCSVVSNGDGTSSMTCPDGDGGMVTVTVKSALVNYASMSADDKAALDLKVAVSSVTVPASGQPVVAFKATDGKGDGVTGLPAADMRFALLKLVSAAKGGNDTWVSYMADDAASVASTETADVTASATKGVLTDNADGTYSYTFAKNVTDPVNAGTTYDGNATHRLAMLISESGNPFAPLNVVKDFIPATGADVTGKAENVDNAACLECHSSFRAKAGGVGPFHNGTRYDLKVCVACHNDQRRFTAIPGAGATPTVDLDASGVVSATGAWTGNAVLVNGEAVVNLPAFIHRLHMGEKLALSGGDYAGISKPYKITFPQDVRNCAKCHREVAQADNFKTKPSRRACGSCHDGTSFLATALLPARRTQHPGGAMADDSTCTTCHPVTAAKTATGIGVLDAHLSVDVPDEAATWLGGTNNNTNASYLSAAGVLPAGAAKITYDLKSVSRDANKNPSIVFRLVRDGAPVVFNVAGTATELMDGFVNSPSVYFAFALPQDGIAAPADFNATASGYIKNIWNGTATGSGAGTMTFDTTTGYYTITVTGITIPDGATMLTGGVGYTYSLSSSPPLTQINLPAYPYGDSNIIQGCISGKMCGGLIVSAPDVSMAATDAVSGQKYGARRAVVSTDNCIKCHGQLGANPSFHAGQRNDAATCAFCHRPNQTSGGWSASSSTFVHGIHAASMRTVGFNWHAACPTGTSFAAGTCTKENADPYFGKVTYPGILNNCQQCHLAGTYDFSAAASAKALPNLLVSTVGAGAYAADISTSPYVKTDGTDYGTGFSTSNLTSGTKDGTACTSTAPCVCSLTTPCQASATTLVKSPITAACSTCHDSTSEITHMQQMGGTFYGARATALAQSELCLICHGSGAVAAIADVHK
jgi:OmcA/MtrC family decaheme c-type cytochrome